MVRRAKYRGRFHGFWMGVAMVATLLACRAARADQVTSKGTVLHGKITGVSSSGITFAPEYGKGSLAIAWADIEDLKSDGSFQLLYGEGEEIDAPLQGVSSGKLVAGEQLPGATQIDVTTIELGIPIGADGLSWEDRTRSYWRYWSGNFDVAFNLQQATTDTSGLALGFKTTRKDDPTRLIFGANYRYGTQKQSGQQTTITQDSAYGLIRGEYDITARLYGFGSEEGTYDAIQKLSIRSVTKAGPGYTLWEEKLDADKRNFFSAEIGPSFVYEGYFRSSQPSHKEYFAVALGLLAGYYLPYGAHFDGLVNYLPSVDDFTRDYLLHSEAALTMPVYDFISAKFSLVDEYSKPPASDAKSNSLYLTFGLSLAWGS